MKGYSKPIVVPSLNMTRFGPAYLPRTEFPKSQTLTLNSKKPSYRYRPDFSSMMKAEIGG